MPLPRTVRPLAAAAASLLLLAGCGDDDDTGDDVSIEDVTEEPGLDYGPLGQIVEGGDQYIGEEVTVTGEVTAQIDDRVFHIAAEPDTDGLLIVSQEPIVDELDSDDVVEVTGIVREKDADSFEGDFGMTYDERYTDFRGRHAIDATSVEVVGQADDPIDE
ncbi:MAG TPA: hypothetical protein VLR27_08310 [Acidimicrobiales bacterium]|nr:hypothetical protein [Acidimicrobiales bacterium]